MPEQPSSPDIEMSDSSDQRLRVSDSADESDEDSPENKALKRASRGRSRKPLQEGLLAVPTDPTEEADEILESGITVYPNNLIPDNHLLTFQVYGL